MLKKFIFVALLALALVQVSKAVLTTDSNLVWFKQGVEYTSMSDIFNSPNGNFIFTNHSGNHFNKIDVNTGEIVETISDKGIIAGFSPDNKYIYTWGRSYGNLKKLDILTYQTVDSMKDYQDLDGAIGDAKLSNDGKIYLSIYQGKYLFVVLDANNFSIMTKIPINLGGNYCYASQRLALSPKNDYLVSDQIYKQPAGKGDTTYANLYLWDLKTLQPLKKIFDGGGDNIKGMKFSFDANFLAMTYGYNLHIFKTDKFNVVQSSYQSVGQIDFSKDNQYIFFGDGINLGDINTINKESFNSFCNSQTLKGFPTFIVKLSNDERFIFVSDKNGTMIKCLNCLYYTDIKENKIIIKDTIYPSPTKDIITIISSKIKDGSNSFQITNELSKVVKKGNVVIKNNSGQISVKELPNGVYFLLINNSSHKFIIER